LAGVRLFEVLKHHDRRKRQKRKEDDAAEVTAGRTTTRALRVEIRIAKFGQRNFLSSGNGALYQSPQSAVPALRGGSAHPLSLW
jgi:hypothetical protein